MQKQLAYILARQQVNVETEDEALIEILNNTKLSENFKRFGKELNVTDPKSLEDIYKSHMDNARESHLDFGWRWSHHTGTNLHHP